MKAVIQRLIINLMNRLQTGEESETIFPNMMSLEYKIVVF